MKVREIIDRCHPVFLPGRSYGRIAELSVLLPTFRRGRDGLFRKALQSILSQPIDRLEVIVVDDASTDGTASIIAQFMKEDARISCIRHTENLGLPAISEFEALQKATAPVIAFAFDDFEYEPHGLSMLLDCMKRHECEAIHGEARMMAGGVDHTLGQASAAHDRLLQHNFIANGAVLLSRNAIDRVGMYDPHIVLSRLCDWDLWRRVRRIFNFESAPIVVGREHGVSRSDSLGNTYPMQFEVVQEYMGSFRDHLLTPSTFPDFDVLQTPDDASYLLTQNIKELRSFFSSKSWYPNRTIDSPPGNIKQTHDARKTVVVFGYLTASISLYWVGEPGSLLDYVTFLDPDAPDNVIESAIVKADLVIFVREMLSPPFQKVINLCRSLNVLHLYFADDHFPIIGKTNPDWSHFTFSSLREELKSFSGIIVSSENLAKSFRDEQLHARIDKINPIFIPALAEKLACAKLNSLDSDDGLSVACFGGMFRTQGLLKYVAPALNKTSGSHFLFTRPMAYSLNTPSIHHIEMPETPFFFRFLKEWSKVGASVVAHPSGRTANIEYKSENAVLVSLYIGAVPIVTDEAAYANYSAECGVEKVENSVEGWNRAFERLQSPIFRADMLNRLRLMCQTTFTDAAVTSLLKGYLSEVSATGADDYGRRYRTLMQKLPLRRPSKPHIDDRGYSILDTHGNLPSQPETSVQRGQLDAIVDGLVVCGWASSDRQDPALLDLEIDGFKVGSFYAALFREDLRSEGIGDGYHAFTVCIPGIFVDEEMHSVGVRCGVNGQHLPGSPKNIQLRNPR